MEKMPSVPCPPFDLKLSHWDKRFMPMYSKRLLCFSLPNNSSADNERIATLLHEALKYTVDQVPFLAGSVVPFSKDQPWLRDIRPQGAAHLEVRDLTVEIDYLELRKAYFKSSLLDAEKLCPYPEAVYMKDDPIDVCRIRANLVRGGLILAVQLIHTVFDGGGISAVLKIFADGFRKAQMGGPPRLYNDLGVVPKVPYSFDRNSVLSGHGVEGNIENHSSWTASPLTTHRVIAPTKNVCTNFHISIDRLRALKLAASTHDSMGQVSSSPEGEQATSPSIRISTHDAVAALLWRSIILVRYRAGIVPSSRDTVYFNMAVDYRSHFNLPDPYFGNAIYSFKISQSLSTITSSTTLTTDPSSPIPGLQDAALAIRTELNSATPAKFRDLLGFVERT